MILKDHSPAMRRFPRQLGIFFLILFVGSAAFYILGTLAKQSVSDPLDAMVFADAEKLRDSMLVFGDQEFGNGHLQTDKRAFNGNYCIGIAQNAPARDHRGFIWQQENPVPEKHYRATVWVYSDYKEPVVNLRAEFSGKEINKSYEAYLPIKRSRGWYQVELYFSTPTAEKKVELLTVSVGTDGTIAAWFDDLVIEEITPIAYQNYLSPKQLNLDFSKKSQKKLNKKKNEAHRVGILVSQQDDWVNAKIKAPDGTTAQKVALRLKGDWLDHLEKKTGYRIKVRKGDTWERMRIFSIHHPKSRSYLNEYVLHKFWEQADVLTTRYDFLKVSINGENQGVYALEEHFDKILLEYQKRREGPIVKYAEDTFWQYIQKQNEYRLPMNGELAGPGKHLATAPIESFQMEKTAATPKLRTQFELAHNLLDKYRTGELSADEVFDLKRMAKYYAILEIMQAYHSLHWNNQRFYYNPVTGKMEPVGYDGFATSPVILDRLVGEGALNSQNQDADKIEYRIFKSPAFVKLYLQYLEKYSDLAFINKFLASVRPDTERLQDLIQIDEPAYYFDEKMIVYRAQKIHAKIHPFPETALRSFTQSKDGDTQNLGLVNMHSFPVEVIGYSMLAGTCSENVTTPVILAGFHHRTLLNTPVKIEKPLGIDAKNKLFQTSLIEPDQQSITALTVPEGAKYICFRTLGMDSVFQTKIKNFPAPTANFPTITIREKMDLDTVSFLQIEGAFINVLPGTHQVANHLVIPAAYTLRIGEGTTLDFVKRAGLVSYGPVEIYGKEETPVLFTSSDKTANGFSVLQAGQKKSKLRYVIFDNFNTLDYNGWTLTGAVNFYESPVNIDHCIFRNNHCEDGLNIVRSNFELKNSAVINTPFDGLDVDFSEGLIRNCSFRDTDNDGMDFSGSEIVIEKATVDNAGDKGLSVGEETDVVVKWLYINGATIGVAAKDLSTVLIQQITLDNCEQGFAAYQKKAEYGGSKIIVNKVNFKNLRRQYNIQRGCVLQIGDKVIEGE